MCPEERIQKVRLLGHHAAVRVFPAQQEQAPSILALHGFTGSGLDFLPLRESLGAGACHWICPDFMGHGASDSPMSLDPYRLDAVLKLIDSARNMAPDPCRVLLLGYSMGGRMALHYLARSRHLPTVLIGASPGIKAPGERKSRCASDRRLATRILKEGVEAFVREWVQQPLIAPQTKLPEPLCSHLARRRLGNNPTGLANSLLACGTGSLTPLWNELSKLPTLILVHGKDDLKFAAIAAGMRTGNPDFKVVEVPGCGHSPHLENPPAVANLLKKLLP